MLELKNKIRGYLQDATHSKKVPAKDRFYAMFVEKVLINLE